MHRPYTELGPRPLNKELIESIVAHAHEQIAAHNATTDERLIDQLDAFSSELADIKSLIETANTASDLMHLRRRADHIVRELKMIEPVSYRLTKDQIIDAVHPATKLEQPRPTDIPAKAAESQRPPVLPKPLQPTIAAAVKSTEPVQKSSAEYAQYADEQGIRQRYDELRQQEKLLKQKIASWQSFLQRGNLRVRLDRVQQDLTRYRQKFPFVEQPRNLKDAATVHNEQRYQTERVSLLSKPEYPAYLGDRQDALNKAVAIERANAALQSDEQAQLRQSRSAPRVVEPENYRRSSELALANLKELVAKPPRSWKAYQAWEVNAAVQESYLSNAFELGSAEQLKITDYWASKIYLLEQVKPLLFGRSAWQKLYDAAYAQRRATIHKAMMRRSA